MPSEIENAFDMRELLEAILDGTGRYLLAPHYVVPAVLAIGIVGILLASRPGVRRFYASWMVAVWVFFAVWMLLDLIETFAFDKVYGYFLIMFPGVMWPSLMLSAIGLALHRLIRKREARKPDFRIRLNRDPDLIGPPSPPVLTYVLYILEEEGPTQMIATQNRDQVVAIFNAWIRQWDWFMHHTDPMVRKIEKALKLNEPGRVMLDNGGRGSPNLAIISEWTGRF